MNGIKLLLPNKKYKQSYEELILSAKNEGDYQELGNALIRKNETFDDMLKRLEDRKIGKNIDLRDVPATVFWIMSDDKIVGTIDLRHKLNKDYYERLGHIAYYIKPEERNKEYATKALSLALEKYCDKHIEKVLITCFSDNIASVKVIEKNGGTLECKYLDKITKKYISRYWINVRRK